mgnify:CR=1 FL=1
MKCYICGSSAISRREGEVRDAPDIEICECDNCGLVFLESLVHIQDGFYEESGMHGDEVQSMDAWLNETSRDDDRRFSLVKEMLLNKRVLDFGCGSGGFLQRAKGLAAEVVGIELEARVREYWSGRIKIFPDLDSVGEDFDLVTSFHVLEHIKDPREVLKQLAKKMKLGKSRLVLEVPSADDVLMSLYDCDAFQRFTYWSQHLFLFNAANLALLAKQTGLSVVAVQHYQRYPLSNHLYWLSQGRPGGHSEWSFLDTSVLTNAYADALSALGKTDTLIINLERGE